MVLNSTRSVLTHTKNQVIQAAPMVLHVRVEDNHPCTLSWGPQNKSSSSWHSYATLWRKLKVWPWACQKWSRACHSRPTWDSSRHHTDKKVQALKLEAQVQSGAWPWCQEHGKRNVLETESGSIPHVPQLHMAPLQFYHASSKYT